jgi:transcriptional regulator NrdR family protein
MAAHCPLCAATDGTRVRTGVVTTRHDPAAGIVIRYRRCPVCRASVQTTEQVVTVRPAGARPVPLVVSAADGR